MAGALLQRSVTVVALVSLALLSGCASSTRIFVKSTERTNDGNTLYMAVRVADPKAPLSNEQYQQAAAKLFTDPPDPSILTTQPVFPGQPSTVTLEDSSDKDVVLYFFFTNPSGQDWRVPLHKPLPAEVYIDLGQHRVERVQIRKR